MYDNSTQCAHGTKHNCVDVPLETCTVVTNTSDNSTFGVLVQQTNNSIEATTFTNGSCTVALENVSNIECGGCSTSGSYQVLCFNQDSSAMTISIPSVLVLMSIIALFISLL
ncbi:hypothetical protein DFA_05760 [Cavenderia fasciculata]|uniref:Transmembrane protein n=1 Tax=Cavenderia fasciculata TaxID=261658 RepID=F4PMH9_CACFS|nr:uncharacterized protein DFA_05760 [Cavenderia fasciculata]EGG23626.1 hypothetical protein DFA_05760 [Cavenderia fasciculata]|eukprot:XP_004361477.1 hypothetical protein DFA_05760 [Cavenderia fasciculata]